MAVVDSVLALPYRGGQTSEKIDRDIAVVTPLSIAYVLDEDLCDCSEGACLDSMSVGVDRCRAPWGEAAVTLPSRSTCPLPIARRFSSWELYMAGRLALDIKH